MDRRPHRGIPVKNVQIFNRATNTWEALDLTKEYKLAGYNYTLRDLGDGFAMFKGAVNELDYVMQDYMVLANYVQSFENGHVTGYKNIDGGDGRITFVFQKAPAADSGPQTGDETAIGSYVVTSTVTLLALGACLALRRRKTQK